MLTIFSRYGLAAHLAIVAIAPLFLSPIAALWLCGLGLLWLLMEPSRIGGESLYNARSRVLSAVVRDPLFWVLAFLVLVSGIRALNTGIERSYDAENGVWALSSASSTILPGSVEGTGLPLFVTAVAALIVLTGCRHALGRSARFAFLLVGSFLSAIGMLVWSVLLGKGSPEALALAEATLESPSYIGSAAGVYLSFAVLALAAAFEQKWLKAMPLVIIGVVGNAVGLFLFAPPVVTLGFFVTALIIFLVSFLHIRLRLGNPGEFKFLVVFGIGLALALLVVLTVTPRALEAAKIAPYLDDAPFLPASFLPTRDVLANISQKAWMSSPWLGNGLGSFPLSLSFLATSADWAVVSPCQTAPLSGYWMILAERGVVGAFLLAVPVVLMLVTFIIRLIRGLKALPHPLVLLWPLLIIAAGLEMWGDVSFLAPGALLPLASALALSPHGFLKESTHG